MKLLRILKLVYNPRSRALYSLTYIVERISYSSSSGQYGAYSIAYSIHARHYPSGAGSYIASHSLHTTSNRYMEPDVG